MRLKIYNGISGALKIICAVVVGLVVGGIAVFQWGESLPSMNTEDTIYVLSIIRMILTVAGSIGIILRSFLQIKSYSKPREENRIVAFCIDVITVILIYLSKVDLLTAACIFDSEIILEMVYYMGIAFIILIVIDAIVLLISMYNARDKIFTEANCISFIRTIQKTVIPSLAIGTIVLIIGMGSSNIKQQKLNDALSGGFNSFTMTDFDGNEYTEDLLKGHKVTMVNIWGTFCHPCIEEMPAFEEISHMYDTEDLQIVGITGDIYTYGTTDFLPEQIDVAKDIIEKTGVKYTVLIPSKEIQLGVINRLTGYPTTVFFNEKGEEIGVVIGGRDKESWIDIIEEYMSYEK